MIASAVDANFLPYVGPVAASIARFASADRPIEYRVFYSGPESADTRALDGYRDGPLTIRLAQSPGDLEKFRGRSRMGIASLVRLQLPELMPDIDRVVYLDADLIVRADIGELFDSNLVDRPMGAVFDFTLYARLAKQQPLSELNGFLRNTIGLSDENWYTYQNTGVLLMDLKALRAEGFVMRAMSLLDERVEQFPWGDQDCINILQKDRLAALDPKWNVLVLVLKERHTSGLVPVLAEGIQQQMKNRAIVHFAGGIKPWQRTSHMPHAGEWWHFAASSPTYRTIKSRFDALRRGRRRLSNPITALARYAAGIRYGDGTGARS